MESHDNKVPIPPSERKSRPRLYHRKSRHGCWRCRQRRVKCDQARPDCNNCQRHNVPCYYDRGHEEDTNAGPSTPPAGSLLQSPDLRAPSSYIPTTSVELGIDRALITSRPYSTYASPSLVAPQLVSPTFSIITPQARSIASSASPPILPAVQYAPDRHLELLILHNFTVHTSAALTGTDIPKLVELWAVRVPKLAIAYEPLLNAMLAFSALHMLSSPSAANDPALPACRGAYLESAVTHYRATLGSNTPLSPEVADATCFTSILLLADALASVRDRELEPYTPPINWLRIGRGVRFVFEKWAYQLEKTHPDAAVLTLFHESIELSTPSSIFVEANVGRFLYLFEPRTVDGRPLLDLALENNETTLAYRDMVSHVGTLQVAIESDESRQSLVRRIVVFATIVPNAFIEQLESKQPKAMLILAHFWAITARIAHEAGGLWWVGTTPWREVDAMRRNVPLAWQHLFEWPLQVLAEVREAQMKTQASQNVTA